VDARFELPGPGAQKGEKVSIVMTDPCSALK
jgi:hypothetical protein